MTPEEVVSARALAISAVTAMVGARVYLQKLPQHAAFPAVRVQDVSERTSYHARGGSGVYESRIQVDAYAVEGSGLNPFVTASVLGAALHGDDAGSGLSGWQGVAGGSPATIRVHAVFRVDRVVGYESEELRQVRCRQDYQVHWSYLQ